MPADRDSPAAKERSVFDATHIAIQIPRLVRLHFYGRGAKCHFYITRAHNPHFVIAFDPWPRIVP